MPCVLIKNLTLDSDPALNKVTRAESTQFLSPFPKELQFSDKFIGLTPYSELHWFGPEILRTFFDEFYDELQWRKMRNPIIKRLDRDCEFDPRLKDCVCDEAYILNITPEMLEIQAKSEKGIFYAIQTFYQLLFEVEGHYRIPVVQIFDYPDMQIRGLSDDMSRGQVATVENVKKFIKVLSRFKLNHYQLYWEDIFQNSVYPDIGRKRGGWTREDVQDVQKFAKEHCMEIYPVQECLGHMETYFRNPKFIPFAEFPGSACMNMADPKAYDFIETIFE